MMLGVRRVVCARLSTQDTGSIGDSAEANSSDSVVFQHKLDNTSSPLLCGADFCRNQLRVCLPVDFVTDAWPDQKGMYVGGALPEAVPCRVQARKNDCGGFGFGVRI